MWFQQDIYTIFMQRWTDMYFWNIPCIYINLSLVLKKNILLLLYTKTEKMAQHNV